MQNISSSFLRAEGKKKLRDTQEVTWTNIHATYTLYESII